MKKVLLLMTMMVVSVTMFAQKMKVESMKETTQGLASMYKREDIRKNPCALVRVYMVTDKATFNEKQKVGDVEDKGNEYWVYMPDGSKRLTVRAEGFEPITVEFADYGIKKLDKLKTYDLHIDVPRLSRSNQLQTVVFNVVPSTAKLVIDNREYKVENGTFKYDLGAGKHNFALEAEYYHPYSGEFLLDGKAEQKQVKVEMKRKQVDLAINSDPEGADVLLDSKRIGVTPIEGYKLDAGVHQLTLQKKNFKTEEKGFTAKGDDPVSFTFPLNAFIPITIKSNGKANIKVDGEDLGTTPITIQRPSGDYSIELSKFGYHDKSDKIHVDGKKSVYKIKMKRRFFYPDNLYLSGDFGFGNMTTVGATIGGFISNFNIEASFGYGLDKKEEIYWLPNYSEKATLASDKPVKYDAMNTGLKMGYGMLLGNRIRFTPQIGLNYTAFIESSSKNENTSSSDQEMTSVLKGCCGARIDIALFDGFCLAVSPEYNFKISSGKPYDSMAKISDSIDKASKGFRMVCSLVYNFNLDD